MKKHKKIIHICKIAKYNELQHKENKRVSVELDPHLPSLVNMVVSCIYFCLFMQVLLTEDGDWEVINL